MGQWVLIQVAAFHGSLEEALDLLEFLDHRSWAVALIEADLPVSLTVLEAHSLKVLVAHHADEIPHGTPALLPRALADLISSRCQAVCHKVAQLQGLGLYDAHSQLPFFLGLLTFALTSVGMA